MSESNPPIKVQILGKEYPVACSPEEQHELLIAARYLDEKMRLIRDTGRVIGTERIAVMAALNIAHEFLQRNHDTGAGAQSLAGRLSAVRERLDGGHAAE
ncbi:MAG: cell division protein ZapA [Gammaproteobacteria bacterium]|nr:cell division protein ZapA [Gammaproteobacteria bacterium]